MRFVSLLVVTCGLVSAAVLPENPKGSDLDPTLVESWHLAQVVDFTGNITALLEDQGALQERSLKKRACFATGEQFGDQKITAMEAVSLACYNKLQYTHKRGIVRELCMNLRNNKRINIKIGLIGPNAPETRFLSGKECQDGMLSEINNCSHGGATTYGRWYYRVDPNKGYC